MYDTLYAILNKGESATLHYFIFCEKILDEKYLLKINNVFQTSASDSSKLRQFVSFDVWVMFLFVFKVYSLNFEIAHAQKYCYGYQNSSYLCCINTEEKVLSLETSSETNF